MANFWFEHPTVFITADEEWKAKLSHSSSTASYAHRSPQTYMACVAWCGIGHQAMHIVHLKPTWRMWHVVVYNIKLCTSFTSNLHGVCGMLWYRTSSYAHRSPKIYMACVAWCGIGHQAMHIVHLKYTWRVWHGVV